MKLVSVSANDPCGCVFMIDDNKLVKIVKSNSNEVKISNLIRQINNYDDHFIVFDEHSFEIDDDIEQQLIDVNCEVYMRGLRSNEKHLYRGYYMKYGGVTFNKYISKKPSWTDIWSIIHQIIVSVNILHENGIVHNDLKEDNIVILKEGNLEPKVKIIDFGLSWLKSDNVVPKLNYTESYPLFLYVVTYCDILKIEREYGNIVNFFSPKYLDRNIINELCDKCDQMKYKEYCANVVVPNGYMIDLYVFVERVHNYLSYKQSYYFELNKDMWSKFIRLRNMIINPYQLPTMVEILEFLL